MAAERITLQRVIAPFEVVAERRCLVGRPACGDSNPCTAHTHWKKVATAVEDFFKQTTVADLIAGNPRATAETREVMRTFRKPKPRTTHGPVAKRRSGRS